VGWTWNIDGHGTFGTQNVTVGYNQPGTFGASLIALTNFGCTDTIRLDSVAFAYPIPVADFMSNPDKATIADPSFQFADESTGNVAGWSWTFDAFGTASAQNPIFTFPDVGEFFVTLEVTSVNGCTDQTTQMVTVEGISEIWIPNAFTPNGDGINETFFPIGTNLTQDVFLEVLVYNRWGDLVYEGSDPNKPWDGSCGNLTSCPVGAYSYKVTYINEKGDFKEFMGRVSLVR
jgi:gliding motility-associated-like protein